MFLTYVAVLVVLSLFGESSASRISFQATPSNIYPVLTKSLKLRCAVDDVSNNSGQTRSVKNRAFSIPAKHTLLAPSPHPSTSPYPSISSTASTHPTIKPTPSHAVVSHIMSIIISRHDKATGHLQTVARLSPYDTPAASVDLDNIKVEGNTESSPISREKGYLEVSWDYPSPTQSGDYICDIYALDTTLHPVSLSSSIQITVSPATVSELAGFVAQNEKYINQLKQSLSEVTHQLSILKLENQAQLQAIVNATDSLQNITGDMKAQNIQTGTIACNNAVTFQKPFNTIPTLFISIHGLQGTYTGFNGNWNFAVTIQTLSSIGFSAACSLSQTTITDLKWIAIDN